MCSVRLVDGCPLHSLSPETAVIMRRAGKRTSSGQPTEELVDTGIDLLGLVSHRLVLVFGDRGRQQILEVVRRRP